MTLGHRCCSAFPALVVAALLFAATPCFAAGDPAHPVSSAATFEFDEHVPGAERLEGRIRAPCCMHTTGQTLDIHGSPVALELRREIRTRLKNGESADSIEADLVKRYGADVLAAPPGNAMGRMGVVLAAAFAVAGVGAAWILVGWRRRSKDVAPKPEKKPKTLEKRDELDERIDAELRDL